MLALLLQIGVDLAYSDLGWDLGLDRHWSGRVFGNSFWICVATGLAAAWALIAGRAGRRVLPLTGLGLNLFATVLFLY